MAFFQLMHSTRCSPYRVILCRARNWAPRQAPDGILPIRAKSAMIRLWGALLSILIKDCC